MTTSPHPAPSPGWFIPAVVAVIGTHLALWGVVMAGGWLYWDDFILQGQAARLGLSADLLLNNHDGHVMPATYAVVWLIQEVSGLNYGFVVATMLLGELALIAAAIAAFTTLLGRGIAALTALAVFLLSPIMLPGLTWWSAALTLVPLMTCALFATVSHVRYLRTGSRAALITTFALVVAALGFFEKSLLIPGWLFLVTVLVDPQPRFWAAARRALTQRLRLWGGWALLMVIYLIGFAQVAQGRTHLPTGPGQVLELVKRAVFNTIAPSLVGGPLRWTPVDYSASYSDPPVWVIVLGLLVTGTIVVAGVQRPGPARKAWIVAGLYLVVDLATFAIGRLGPDGDPGVVQAGRYVATAMIPISVAIGATVRSERARLSQPRLQWSAFAAVCCVGLLTLFSSLAYASIWAKNPAQGWVGNARADLANADPRSPLLDQEVPDFLLLPVTHPYNLASWFLAPLSQQPGFATSTDSLRLIDNRGHLVPARIDGAASLPPADGCYAVAAGGSVTIPLEHPVFAWSHTVAVNYLADEPGFITVAIGAGDPVAAEILGGQGSAYVRAEGGESTVTIRSADTALCITGVEVGKVVPRDLPYGGTVDLSDQLQGLD
ncbi:MAG TPA: hypothetical protein PLT68_03565 [Actinomycetota bacterium]|nr:hypothetical protein [Actinomycetota bacterium]